MKSYEMNENGTKGTYLNKPNETKYRIEYWPKSYSSINITVIKTGEQWIFNPCEFVYNSPNFNKVVEKYPNYVHRAVWILHDNLK